MPDILDHVAYLSQEIGPRPAGTEEEQQAALYITEQMQKDAGLSAIIEDFSGAPGAEAPRVICCAATLVITVLALFLPVVGVASIVITLIAALLFAAEVFNRPVLSRAFARGVSQNVVAKYEPSYSAEAGGSRRRKVIVVSRYDSGKVRAELNGPLLSILPILQWATFGAMVFLPLLLIVRNVIFLNAEGVTAIVLNVLACIALVLVALPIVFALLHKLASYNEAANCNAAGTAVMMEVARRVGRGRVSEAELAARTDASIHGEDAARAAGLVPEGAQLVYEAASVKPPEPAPQTPEARLAAAKAAVAALSGKPVTGVSASDIAQNLVQIKEPPLPTPTDEGYRELRGETREALSSIPEDTMQEALANAEAAAAEEAARAAAEAAAIAAATAGMAASSYAAVSQASEPSDGVPDWFKKAQEKAKKPRADKPVQRSKFASALDAADEVSENAAHFSETGVAAERKPESATAFEYEEAREVKAPQWHAPEVEGAAAQAGAEAVEAPAVEGVYDMLAPDGTQAVASPLSAPQETAPAAPVDPFSTTAMPPIDVSELRLDDLPPINDVPMPSFLDPRKVQEEARAAQADEHRTGNRVDVTGAPIGASGRIDVIPDRYDDPAAAAPQAEDAAPRPIVLPDIGVSAANLPPISELPKQRAPLADVESSGKSAAKSLLTMLPSINVGEEPSDDAPAGESAGASDQAAVEKKHSLRSILPSLSGSISRTDIAEGKTSNVSAAGAFVPAGATGTFAPIGDELLDNVDPDDIYIDDADDSAYDQNFTETGAFAGPGYVEMPKSRVHRLFDRLRRKNKDQEPSPQEWLEVDETFDARTVGAERGGWESFREDDGLMDPGATTQMNPYEAGYEDDEYDTFEDDGFDGPYEYDNVDEYDDGYGPDERRPWHGGAFSPRRMERAELDREEAPGESFDALDFDDPDVPAELKQIYQFRNPDINTEVWFVALGSELAQNGGMRAFLTEHQQDLRGSIIIDLDALGAGDLCMVEQEGMYRSVKTSSRMKRYVKKASQATGLNVGSAQIKWKDSASSYAIKQGYQAMHLAGMDGAKPAFFAQGDDVLENIDEQTLEANADFVMELLKNI